VAVLTCGIAENIERFDRGPYRGVRFSFDDMREIRYAALLHDFGKVGVREHVLTKANKLYPLQLELIEARFNALCAQREAEQLRAFIAALQNSGQLADDIAKGLLTTNKSAQDEVRGWIELIRRCNQPTILESGGFEQLQEIGKMHYEFWGKPAPLLSETELQCLSIPRGSLEPAERLEIESHVTHTFRFLAQIPWTRTLRRVPEIAYAHHEKLDGAGYPRQLVADQIPLQARMMTIADIYDALTASDRPYKKAASHEVALDILNTDALLGKVDADLLELFIQAKVFEAVKPMRLR
jgi:response regulator RpfG family c-di-GMP phosphodiesterase